MSKTNRFDEQLPETEMKIKKHVIEALVEDQPGVLQRIAGMFAKRGFNIDTITVGKTMRAGISKMIIVVVGDDTTLEKVIKQMNKLLVTYKVDDIPEKDAIVRELCLLKISLSKQSAKNEILNYAKVYKTKVVNINQKSATIEIIGTPDKIEAFISLMKVFGITDISRTGVTAISRR